MHVEIPATAGWLHNTHSFRSGTTYGAVFYARVEDFPPVDAAMRPTSTMTKGTYKTPIDTSEIIENTTKPTIPPQAAAGLLLNKPKLMRPPKSAGMAATGAGTKPEPDWVVRMQSPPSVHRSTAEADWYGRPMIRKNSEIETTPTDVAIPAANSRPEEMTFMHLMGMCPRKGIQKRASSEFPTYT